MQGQTPEQSELEAELCHLKEENMELQELYETTDKEKRVRLWHSKLCTKYMYIYLLPYLIVGG